VDKTVRLEGPIIAQINALSKLLTDGREMWEGIGFIISTNIMRYIFPRGGEPAGSWPKVSAITVMLRKGNIKLFSWADAVAKSGIIKPLMDTGALSGSIVSNAYPNRVEVGTGVRGYENCVDKTTTFQMTPDAWANFNKNVSKELLGSKGYTFKAGYVKKGQVIFKKKVFQARKNWNPFYFIMRNTFKKWDGFKTFLVKAREWRTWSPEAPPAVFNFLNKLFKKTVDGLR